MYILGDEVDIAAGAEKAISRHIALKHAEVTNSVWQGLSKYDQPGLGLRNMLEDKHIGEMASVSSEKLKTGLGELYTDYQRQQKALEKQLKVKFKGEMKTYVEKPVKDLGDHVFKNIYASFDSTALSAAKQVGKDLAQGAVNQVREIIGEEVSTMVADMAGSIGSTLGMIGGPLAGIAVGFIAQGIFSLFRKSPPTPAISTHWTKDYPDPLRSPVIPNLMPIIESSNSMLALIEKVHGSRNMVKNIRLGNSHEQTTYTDWNAQVLVANTLYELTEHEREDLANFNWLYRFLNHTGTAGDHTIRTSVELNCLYGILARQCLVLERMGGVFTNLANDYGQKLNMYREVSGNGKNLILSGLIESKGKPKEKSIPLSFGEDLSPIFFQEYAKGLPVDLSRNQPLFYPWGTKNRIRWPGTATMLAKYKKSSLVNIREESYPPLIIFMDTVLADVRLHMSPLEIYAKARKEFRANVDAVHKLMTEGAKKTAVAVPAQYGTTVTPQQQALNKILAYKFMRTAAKTVTKDLGKTIERVAPALKEMKKAEERTQMLKTFAIVGAAAGGLYLLTKKK